MARMNYGHLRDQPRLIDDELGFGLSKGQLKRRQQQKESVGAWSRDDEKEVLALLRSYEGTNDFLNDLARKYKQNPRWRPTSKQTQTALKIRG